jgi:hypothetical protein
MCLYPVCFSQLEHLPALGTFARFDTPVFGEGDQYKYVPGVCSSSRALVGLVLRWQYRYAAKRGRLGPEVVRSCTYNSAQAERPLWAILGAANTPPLSEKDFFLLMQ